MVAGSDGAFKGFVSGCIKNPDKCPLAKNKTEAELEADLTNFFVDVKYNPIPLAGAVIDYTAVKSYVFNNLYRPRVWPNMSIALDSLIYGDGSKLLEIISSDATIPAQDQAILGIRCGDKVPRASSLAELDPAFDDYRAASKWFADWQWGYYVMACARWQFEAKERYLGDFNVKTKNPLLFVGNPNDPVTPLISAHNMSSGFDGSVVLQHNGYGVSLLTSPPMSSVGKNLWALTRKL